jgi:hypothetical protein
MTKKTMTDGEELLRAAGGAAGFPKEGTPEGWEGVKGVSGITQKNR